MRTPKKNPFQLWQTNLVSIPYTLSEDIIPNSTNSFLLIEADDNKKFADDILHYLHHLKINDVENYETEIFKNKLTRIAHRIDYCNYEDAADITVKLAHLIYNDINDKRVIKFKHLALTIGELLLNAIVYGNQLDLTIPVFFSWEINKEHLIISVGDYGIDEVSFTSNDVESMPECSFSKDFWQKVEFADEEKLSGSGLGVPAILKICGFQLTSHLIRDENHEPLGKIIKAVKALQREKDKRRCE
ncbi:MAG: hypothetical protein ACMUJM_15615 [bacterium]